MCKSAIAREYEAFHDIVDALKKLEEICQSALIHNSTDSTLIDYILHKIKRKQKTFTYTKMKLVVRESFSFVDARSNVAMWIGDCLQDLFVKYVNDYILVKKMRRLHSRCLFYIEETFYSSFPHLGVNVDDSEDNDDNNDDNEINCNGGNGIGGGGSCEKQ